MKKSNKLMVSMVCLMILTVAISCKTPDVNDTIEVYQTFSELEARYQGDAETTYVLNFWATTCPPCLKEMPHFSELNAKYIDENVKIVLISLDQNKGSEERVKRFVQKHKITPEVVILKDDNYSAWTGKIDPSWYGALPATLIKKGDKSIFQFGIYESYEDLEKSVLGL